MTKNEYNIASAVTNIGSGSISTGDIISNTITQNISNENRKEFLELIFQIEKEVECLNDKNINDSISIIKEETKKEIWNNKLLSVSLNSILGVISGVTANIVTPLIQQGLSMLPL